MNRKIVLSLSAIILALAFAACTTTPTAVNPAPQNADEAEYDQLVADVVATLQGQPSLSPTPSAQPTTDPATGEPTVTYTLVTGMGPSGMAFIGQGGEIDGVANPELTAKPGDVVQIVLIDGDGIIHDWTLDTFNITTGTVQQMDEQKSIQFVANQSGDFAYYCGQPGHRQAGMEGVLRITDNPEAAQSAVPAEGENIVLNPADIPAPVGSRAPETVRVDLVAKEVEGQLADGTTFTYFTFNGTVPGPMIRVRVGDTIELHLSNDPTSMMGHSIDLHAATGPGGGAVYTQTQPGEETMFTFKALQPGAYVYHCATPSVAEHIANGMYGLIVVEPEGGLSPVDHEFYVMQGEIYTAQPFGTQGHLDFGYTRMLDEDPEYYVFNGASMALTSDENALRANVGETVRIFFGVGGPNATSSFHVIGEIFDRVWPFASLTADPLTDVQTVTVPPGGATVVEFKLDVPGRYILVDHALSRLERGLAGFLYVEGDPQPDIIDGTPTSGSGH